MYRLIYLLTIINFLAIKPLYAYEGERTDNPFFVSDITITSEVNSGKLNLEIAKEKGAKEAIQKVMKRISPYNEHWKLDAIYIKDFMSYVEDLETNSERINSSSYMAKASYMLKPSLIKEQLQGVGVIYATHYSPYTLILPILHEKGNIKLWSSHPWHQAWRNTSSNQGLMRFTFADGDLNDMVFLELDKVMVSNFQEFSPLLQKYQSKELIILDARESGNILDIKLRFLGPDHDSTEFISYIRSSKDSKVGFYNKSVLDIANKIDARWKGLRPFDLEYMQKNMLRVKFDDIKQIAALQKRLQTFKEILSVEIRAMTMNTNFIRVKHTLNSAALAELLKDMGWEVDTRETSSFILTPKH